MSNYSPRRDEYESEGSIDESQNSYGSEEEEDSNHGREQNYERYAIQRRQPPGELIVPLIDENKELRAMNKNLMYKVYDLKVIQKNLTSEIDKLKDVLIDMSLKNDALIRMNEELVRESDIEENAKTSFNIGGYGLNFRLNRETGNKQRMKHKLRE